MAAHLTSAMVDRLLDLLDPIELTPWQVALVDRWMSATQPRPAGPAGVVRSTDTPPTGADMVTVTHPHPEQIVTPDQWCVACGTHRAAEADGRYGTLCPGCKVLTMAERAELHARQQQEARTVPVELVLDGDDDADREECSLCEEGVGHVHDDGEAFACATRCPGCVCCPLEYDDHA